MHKLYNYFYLFFYLQLARLAFLKFLHFVFSKEGWKGTLKSNFISNRMGNFWTVRNLVAPTVFWLTLAFMLQVIFLCFISKLISHSAWVNCMVIFALVSVLILLWHFRIDHFVLHRRWVNKICLSFADCWRYACFSRNLFANRLLLRITRILINFCSLFRQHVRSRGELNQLDNFCNSFWNNNIKLHLR